MPLSVGVGRHAPRMFPAMVRVSAPRCPMCHAPQGSPSLSTPGLAAFPRGLQGHTFGAPRRPTLRELRAQSHRRAALDNRVSRRGGLGWRESRRCAVLPHPPSAGPRRDAPRLTAPARPAGPSSPRRAILPPRKPPVKGAPGGRVPPLRSAQTLDSELPRQDPTRGREDGGGNGEACEAGTWRGQSFTKPCPNGESF